MADSFLALGCLACAFSIVWWVRRRALARGLLDHPNARSSHQIPTPRGGGLGIAVSMLGALALLWFEHRVGTTLFGVIGIGGAIIAAIGAIDDTRSLSVSVRLPVQLLVAAASIVLLQGLGAVKVGSYLFELGVLGYVLGFLAIVWTLNLFNFVDGIDGIAASEAIFISCGWCVLGASQEVSSVAQEVSSVAIALAAACAGFLLWNWPPAKIFMGDVGSGFLGYVIAVLAIDAAQRNTTAVFVWLILGAVFFADATVTLLRRLLRRESVFEAHRSHAYQILARRWNSHQAVTLAVMAVNVVVLLPMAWLATVQPSWAAAISIGTVGALGVVAVLLGAGSDESTRR